MGNLFTHHPKPQGTITDVDRAVLSLKAQRRKLEDQSKLLEKRIEHNITVAKELISANKKDRALLALKKKKLNERQLQSIGAWLLNVEDMLSSMELSQQQQRIFTALKDGNAALKAAQAEWTLEDVEKLMDETAEAKEYQDKVANIVATQLGDTDAEAVEAEFEALEAAVLGTPEQQLQDELAEMPAAPTHAIEAPPAAEAAAAEAAQDEGGAEAAAEQDGEEAGAEEERAREEPLLAA